MTTADAGAHVTALSSGWQRTVLWWDVAFYAVLALTAVAVLLTPGLTEGRLSTTLAALGVLLVAYLLLGRRAARTRERGIALGYLVLLVAATSVAVAQTPTGTFLLFAAFSQIWMLSDRIDQGVAFTVVLAVGVTVALAATDGFSGDSLAQVALQMGVVLVFSVGLGLWVASSMRRTEQMARTLDELHAAREELAAAHRAEGMTAERERMAQEIHDTLAQGFTSIVMLAQGAETELRRGHPDAAAERIALVERTARDNLAEARALVAAFAPVALDGAGLGEALGRLAARFTQETGLPVDVVLPDGGVPLAREHEVILLRAAQEALANVRRHAGAHRVEVALLVAGGGARLEVVDDGRGIDPAAAEGFGLRGMRERVASGGGELTVTPGVHGGTRVRVSLPVAAGSATAGAPAPEGPR